MRSAQLALLDAFGDAIVAQFVTDSITAEVVTNPTQGGSAQYVVLRPAPENDQGSPKDSNVSTLFMIAQAYSGTLTGALTMGDSIMQAVGRDVTLTLASPFYHVSTSLESNDPITDPRPEGDIYSTLLTFLLRVGHTA